MRTLYRIHWKNEITGSTGECAWLSEEVQAEAWKEHMNREYLSDHITHWIEPETVEDEPAEATE